METEEKTSSWGPIVALVLVLLAAVATAVFFASKYYELRKDPSIASRQEIQGLVEEVGKLIELPGGEDPTVATVVDPEALQTQPFFANAKKDDKLLIYPNARKAILYSPARGKIIEVGPIAIGPGETAPAPEPSASPNSETEPP